MRYWKETQIKLIFAGSLEELEEKVNEFLEDRETSATVDIRYADRTYHAIVTYHMERSG